MGFIGDLLGIGGKGASFEAGGGPDAGELSLLKGMQHNAFLGQNSFLTALANQGGIGNQSNVFGQQQALADILGQQAMGGGPNPALAQLAQTTGQGIQNQAALMAGQRGINQNPGLAARQIGQVGAQQMQQAGGQAALMRAQQQLAAQQALQNQQSNMAGLASQQVAQQGQAQRDVNAMSGDMLGKQLGMLQANNAANASVAGANVKQGGGLNLLSSIGSGAAKAVGLPFAQGGEVPESMGPQSAVGKYYASMKSGGMVPGKAKVAGDSQRNDTVPALLSPGEVVIPRSKVKDPKQVAAFVNSILGMNLKAA